jgi:hypothetical protein
MVKNLFAMTKGYGKPGIKIEKFPLTTRVSLTCKPATGHIQNGYLFGLSVGNEFLYVYNILDNTWAKIIEVKKLFGFETKHYNDFTVDIGCQNLSITELCNVVSALEKIGDTIEIRKNGNVVATERLSNIINTIK